MKAVTRKSKNVKTKVTTSALRKSNQNLKFKHKSTVYVNRPSKKKIKRKNYSPEMLQHAIDALSSGLSLRKAANAYGVPMVTLFRKKNNPDVKSRPGPATVFSEAEEEKIKNFIIYRADRGHPVTKTELLDSVQKYVELLKKPTPFIENRPGRHWYEAFRKRHPELTIRTVQHLSLTRAAVTREDLKEWFEQIEKHLRSKNLMDISPDRVFNCDETSILLCPDSEKVLTRKGARAAYRVTDDRKESVTTLFTYSAAGTRVPPMLMFAYTEKVPKVIIENTPKDWGIGISENGWMTAETFYEYITNVFYPWLLKENTEFPVILYVDNHSSHITIPLVHFCRDKQIEVIGLYPNSTHIMQPLDIAYFHPFKETWKKTEPKWKNTTDIMQLKKDNFPKVLKIALDNMKDEKSIVINGFKAAGLMPFNSNAIDYDVLQKRIKKKSKSTETDQTEKGNQVPNNYMENEQLFVQQFENNIPAELFQAFKEALKNGAWTGDIEKKALFEYWLQINKKSLDNGLRAEPENHSVKHVNPMLTSESEDMKNDTTDIIAIVTENTEPVIEVINVPKYSDQKFDAQPLSEVIVLQDNLFEPSLGKSSINSIIHLGLITEENTTFEQSKILDFSEIKLTAQELQTLLPVPTETVLNSNVGVENNETEIKSTQEVHTLSQVLTETVIDSPADATNAEDIHDTLNSKRDLNVNAVSSDDMNKENTSGIANQETNQSHDECFSKAFTMPTKYLPKKKRIKLETSGKSKLPASGTSDAWLQIQLEKEEKRRIKEEQIAKRKDLQTQKKALAEEKKKIGCKNERGKEESR